MKKYMRAAMILAITAFANAASAGPVGVELNKKPLTVDFNKMIVEGEQQRNGLKSDVKAQLPEMDIVDDAEFEKAKVLDFVDLEVGWGDSPSTIVDRRFDSVQKGLFYDLNALVPNYLATGI